MCAIVLRDLPTEFKVGEMCRWLQPDNQDLTVTGAQWLLPENRRTGKTHSSLVIYLRHPTEGHPLRMGRKSFRTTAYGWDRPSGSAVMYGEMDMGETEASLRYPLPLLSGLEIP